MSVPRKLHSLRSDSIVNVGGGEDRRHDDLPSALQQAIKACRTLPSASVVVLEVLDLCQDGEIGIAKVSKVIARDPAL